jgi:acyl-CoA thioesterase
MSDPATMFHADQAARSSGISLITCSPGYAELTMTVRPDMLNGHETAHGGFIFLLADTAFAVAGNYPGPPTVAAGADITFVSPARAGELLTARALERTRYGRSGLYDITVSTPDRVIAEFRGRSRTLPS